MPQLKLVHGNRISFKGDNGAFIMVNRKDKGDTLIDVSETEAERALELTRKDAEGQNRPYFEVVSTKTPRKPRDTAKKAAPRKRKAAPAKAAAETDE